MGLNIGNKFLSNCPNSYSNTKNNSMTINTFIMLGYPSIVLFIGGVTGLIGLFFGGKKRK